MEAKVLFWEGSSQQRYLVKSQVLSKLPRGPGMGFRFLLNRLLSKGSVGLPVDGTLPLT